DEDARRPFVRLHDADGPAGLDEHRLVLLEGLQRADHGVEGAPVAGALAGAAVDDQLVRVLGDLRDEVVLQRRQGGRLLLAGGARFGAARRSDGAGSWGGLLPVTATATADIHILAAWIALVNTSVCRRGRAPDVWLVPWAPTGRTSAASAETARATTTGTAPAGTVRGARASAATACAAPAGTPAPAAPGTAATTAPARRGRWRPGATRPCAPRSSRGCWPPAAPWWHSSTSPGSGGRPRPCGPRSRR